MVHKINLDISDDLWKKFKKAIPRTISLNNAVVYLIGREVGQIEKGEIPSWKDTCEKDI